MGRGRVLHMTWYLQRFTSFKTFKVAEQKNKYFDDSNFSFLTLVVQLSSIKIYNILPLLPGSRFFLYLFTFSILFNSCISEVPAVWHGKPTSGLLLKKQTAKQAPALLVNGSKFGCFDG